MEEEIKDIISDKKKVGSFKAELRFLLESPGWKAVSISLLEDVKEIEARMHGELEWEKGDTLEILQKQRNDRIGLVNLPEYLLKLVEENKGYPKNLDPYD